MTQDFSSLRTTEDIINALSVLYFNLNEIERNYYDIFINPKSMTVNLQRYNDQGVLDTVPVKNLASLQTAALTGIGSPDGMVSAEVGKFYIDTSDYSLYFKSSGNDSYGWVLIWSALNLKEDDDYLAPDGSAPQLKDLNMDNASLGTLAVERGGTGKGSITGIVKGNGTDPMTNATDGADFLGPISTVGVICYYPVTPIPYGWLMCDGSAYSKTGDYARLGNKLGNKYNLVGDSDDIFRVPNLMNYDVNNPSTLPYYIRSWNGHDESKVGTVQQEQVGAHNHPLSGNVGVESAHVHDKGSMNITGAFGSDWTYTDGAFYYDSTMHSADNSAGGSNDNTIRFDASRAWTGVTSGPKTLVDGNYESGHTHSMNGLSTSNNTTDSTNENRVSSMLMIPIIKW
jgi:microcystin-dependent protein